MAKKLKNLTLRQIALVDKGANQDAMIVIAKRVTKDDGEINDTEINTPSSEGPCPKCGGDHPLEGHAAAMRSKKPKESAMKTEEVKVEEVKTDETVKAEKVSPTDLKSARKDYEAVTAELAKVRGDLQKQLEDTEKELEETRSEVVKVHKARRREQFIKRASELEHLPGAPADDFGEFLDDVEKALGEKRFAKFNNLLESWNTQMQKSALFTEVGVNGGDFGFSGPSRQLDILAQERVKTDPDLQKLPAKVAYAKAYDRVIQTPEGRAIYKRHLAERK